MLTTAELIAARDKLRTALALIGDVKTTFLSAQRIADERTLNELWLVLGDEVEALDREIGSAKQ